MTLLANGISLSGTIWTADLRFPTSDWMAIFRVGNNDVVTLWGYHDVFSEIFIALLHVSYSHSLF
ncbi:LOW QUALITY PROTEIN: hypothetical protein TorRG33x02_221760 [Trema orientale]|uniref:Uncharacterized protein n=1 Tax=Trema orientale TaxID=63057 RepID=A0A2P5E937_TREOI|nr:LOW QUALITY PROTEIN: hypothetical protein TorRG33x02_221760 [Trema orientale]